MNIAVVLEPPRGKRWRKVLARFGGDSRMGIVTSVNEGVVRAVSFVIERMGGSTLLLIDGDCLSLLAIEIRNQRVFANDILVRCARAGCLPLTHRLVSMGLAILLFPRVNEARKFLELHRLAIARCCEAKMLSNVRPGRKIDADRIARLVKSFSRSWGSRALDKAGVDREEFVGLWMDSLGRCLE